MKSRTLYILFIFLFPNFFMAKAEMAPLLSGNSEYPDSLKVEVIENNGKFKLLRGGKEYVIKGAGGQYYLDSIKACGGNSFRLWSTSDSQESGKTVQELLDEAQELGLTVTMGLWVTHPRHSPDFYGDPSKVTAQLEKFRLDVNKYKNHPALLMWAVGNEVHLETSDTRVWDAVGEIAEMIKLEDPNHPVSTVTANINSSIVANIKSKAPALDLIGINAYGNDLLSLPSKIRNSGWQKAYFIGEYGPQMHWQSSGTLWGAKFEPLNSVKAQSYLNAYQTFEKDSSFCIGTYAFKWGWKWERTYSWINLFSQEGAETEVVDILQFCWSGSYPENRAPKTGQILLNGKMQGGSDSLKAGAVYSASVTAYDPEDETLGIEWKLYQEGNSSASGGDSEPIPPLILGSVTEDYGDSIRLTLPSTAGPYRLYVFAYDNHNNVSISNYPFYVKPSEYKYGADTILCFADTYARAGSYAQDNFGNQTEMVTKITPSPDFTRETFLQFQINDIVKNIDSARIHIFGKIVDPVEIELHTVSNNNWTENTLNWNNKPAKNSIITSIAIPANSEKYFSFDVSNYIKEARRNGAEKVSFAMTAKESTEKEIRWNAKEKGVNPPLLTFSPNDSASNLILAHNQMIVSSGELSTINRDNLLVSGNYPQAIEYTIISLPENGTLLKNQIALNINSIFSQSDIDHSLISYISAGDAMENDHFIFDVTDPTGAILKNQAFTIEIRPLFLDKNNISSNLILYPNPANKILNVELNNGSPITNIDIYNTYGQLIFTSENTSSRVKISTDSFEPGIYIIQISSERILYQSRFIKTL
jgi:hypothetical protein